MQCQRDQGTLLHPPVCPFVCQATVDLVLHLFLLLPLTAPRSYSSEAARLFRLDDNLQSSVVTRVLCRPAKTLSTSTSPPRQNSSSYRPALRPLSLSLISPEAHPQILVASRLTLLALLRLCSPATALHSHQHPSPNLSGSRNPGRDSRLAD